MKKNIRVLQINSGSKEFGGVSSILYNLFLNIDRSKVAFDFLTPQESTYSLKKEEISNQGGQIFDFKIKEKKLKKFLRLRKELRSFLNEHHYDIVHINSGSFIFNLIVSMTIKSVNKNIKVIVHSHNALEQKWSLKKTMIGLLKPLLLVFSDYQLACSKKAAESMFPKWHLKNVKILLNGIDLNKFNYSTERREAIRKEYALTSDQKVIGNVGRLSYQKNQLFTLKLFQELLKYEDNAILFLVGNGPDYEKIQEYITVSHLEKHVIFEQETNRVSDLYCMFDLFILPSKFEGLPLVGVEAQAMGLPLVASSEITEEVKISELVTFIDLKDKKEIWIESILSLIKKNMTNRSSNLKGMEQAGYSIPTVAMELQEFYERISEE